MVAALTTNLKLAAAPGNVRLPKGEAGLPNVSVVNVSQLRTLDRTVLSERIGKLSRDRLRDVLSGVTLVFEIGA